MRKFLVLACSVFLLLDLLFVLSCTWGGDIAVGVLACVLIVAAGIVVMFSRKEIAHFSVRLFLFSFLFFCFVVIVVHNPVTDDFATQIRWARDFINGKWNAYHNAYAESWPNMIGYSIVEIPILYLTDSTTCIKLFQACCMSLSVVLVFKIVEQFASRQVAQISSVALVFFPAFLLASGTTTNQILAATLSLAASNMFLRVYKFRTSKKVIILSIVSSGILLALADFVRSDATVVFIAIIVCIIIFSKDHRTRLSRIKESCSMIAIFTLSFLAVGALITTTLDWSGIRSPATTGDLVAYNKLVMGTSEHNSGGHTNDYDLLLEEKARNEGISYKEAAVDTILENLSTPGKVLRLEIKKAHRLWWANGFLFSLNNIPEETLDWFIKADKASVFALILLCIPGIVALIVRKRTPNPACVFCIVVLTGYLLAYLFIEVQPRYMYFPYIIMVILASWSMQILVDWAKATRIRLTS